MALASNVAPAPAEADGEGSSLLLAQALLDNLSALVAYCDAGLRFRYANRAFERWFGVDPEALLGLHISKLLGPLYPLNLPYIEGALQGETQEFEHDIPDPRGVLRGMDWRTTTPTSSTARCRASSCW
jgi:PAS domain S-box-containing protein